MAFIESGLGGLLTLYKSYKDLDFHDDIRFLSRESLTAVKSLTVT